MAKRKKRKVKKRKPDPIIILDRNVPSEIIEHYGSELQRLSKLYNADQITVTRIEV